MPPHDSSAERPVMRNAVTGDVPAMVRVLEGAFARWPLFDIGVTPEEHLRWKMELGTDLDADRHRVVVIGEEVVGVRLRWLTRVDVRGAEYLADAGADVAVHPAWQGRGIGRVITAERDRQAAESRYLSIQTVSRSPQLLHLNDVPTHIHRPIGIWTRAFSPRAVLSAHLRSRAFRSLPHRLWDSLLPRQQRQAATTPEIVVLEGFDERTDALWELARPTFDLIRHRTADYLNWRYIDGRAGDATVLAAIDGSRVLGFAVFKISGRAANVLDLVVDPGHRTVGHALLTAGTERMRALGALSVTCWLPPGHADEAALRAASFLPVGTTTLDFRRRDQAGPPVAVAVIEDPASRMHVTLGDFDFV